MYAFCNGLFESMYTGKNLNLDFLNIVSLWYKSLLRGNEKLLTLKINFHYIEQIFAPVI